MKYLSFFSTLLLISCGMETIDSSEEQNSSEVKVPENALIRSLPEELYPFEDNILSSRKNFINITLKTATNLSATRSKVGGYPYFPVGMEYPTGQNGKPLDFLAQINFGEIPELELYPQSGLVQFFIATDDLYGLDFDDPNQQKNYRVIYHANPDQASRESFPELDNVRRQVPYLSPKLNNDVFEMIFSIDSGYVPGYSIHFAEYFGKDTWPFFETFGSKEDEIAEAYMEIITSQGHKIGGYPFFTQEDPRMYNEEIEDWILLFQLDTDYDNIMWGDAGVGNFFISKEDLKNLNFANVFYNWDCY